MWSNPWSKPDHCIGITGDLVKLLVLMELCWVGLRSPIPNRLLGEADAAGSWMLTGVPDWSWGKVVGHCPRFK